MSEVKYEAVFGNLDFDDFDLDTAAVCDCGDFLLGITEDELKSRTLSDFRNEPIIAMRRIIKTPFWTLEDKKAGRLPEVGAEVIRVDHEDEGCNVTGVVIATWRCIENNTLSQVCLKLKDGSLFLVDLYEELRPIETPEEKAQRERDEWIDNACSFICFYDIGRVDAIKSLEITYDKLKSGELSMPVKGGE